MINSINFIDGLDGLSSGIAFIAAVTLGLISLTTRSARPAAHRGAVLHPGGSLLGFLRWNFHPASIFTGTSGVSSSATLWPCSSILGTAKVAVALLVLGVPIIDTFWIIVRRLARGPVTVLAGPWPPPPPPPRLRPLAPADGPADLLALPPARAPGLSLSGSTQLYAFLGVFLAIGLVLFTSRGGGFDPDELDF